MSHSEREEELMQGYQLDHEDELCSRSIKKHGLRFNYRDGELESVEWVDPEDFIAWKHERLTDDAIAESSREAQKVLSYAWLLIRQAEDREEDEKLLAQGRSKLRQIESISVDSDMETYLEELCDPSNY